MKKAPTKEESAHMGRVKALPCVVCEMRGEVQTSLTDCHHIKRDPETGQTLGGAQRASHWHTIPLCSRSHHWNSVHVSMGSKEFERFFGNELDLLRLTYQNLGLPYHWENS